MRPRKGEEMFPGRTTTRLRETASSVVKIIIILYLTLLDLDAEIKKLSFQDGIVLFTPKLQTLFLYDSERTCNPGFA